MYIWAKYACAHQGIRPTAFSTDCGAGLAYHANCWGALGEAAVGVPVDIHPLTMLTLRAEI